MELPPRLAALLAVLQLLAHCTGSDPGSAELTSDLGSDLGSNLGYQSVGAPGRDYVRDCSDLPFGTSSGVYMILEDLQTPTPAFCDMDGGEGWTVFQRRADITPRQDFYQDWEAYKWGLGNFNGEFWWGLHHLWQLTSQLDRVYELRVDLWDWDEQTRYATYQKFTIASEPDGYRLDFVDYAGNAGDSLDLHNGKPFTTRDRDNDQYSGNCAASFKGAWWYDGYGGGTKCHSSNLNGLHSPGEGDDIWSGIAWNAFRNGYSLNATTMKIRRTL